MWPFSQQKALYMPLTQEKMTHNDHSILHHIVSLTVILSALAITAVLSYTAGKQSNIEPIGLAEEIIGMRQRTGPFTPDETFVGPPTEERRLAWENILGTNNSFFQHPQLAEELSVFSAFHQVHCVANIWYSWWGLYNNNTEGYQEHLIEHIGHCIELIRHAIMCQPDLTIEVARTQRKSVSGTIAIHQCQDWGDLMTWVDKQQEATSWD